MKLRRSSIRLILAGVLLLSWFTVILSAKQHEGSSYISHPQGTKAIFLLFERIGLKPKRFLNPFTVLSGTNKTLFIIAPETMGHESDLLRWIERGNTVFFFDTRPGVAGRLYKLLGMKAREGAQPFDQYLEHSTSAHFHDGGKERADISGEMSTPGPHPFQPPVDATPLLRARREVRAYRKTLGNGTLYFFSDATAIENERLDRAENLKLFLALVRHSSDILFDEFHHGFTAPAPTHSQTRIEALYFFTALLLCWIILGALSRAIRFGPPVPEIPQPPATTEAYVSALGLLYFDHRAASALSRFVQTQRERIEAQFGISTGLSHGQCAANLVQRGLVTKKQGQELAQSLAILESLPDGDTRVHDEAFWSRMFSILEAIFTRGISTAVKREDLQRPLQPKRRVYS